METLNARVSIIISMGVLLSLILLGTSYHVALQRTANVSDAIRLQNAPSVENNTRFEVSDAEEYFSSLSAEEKAELFRFWAVTIGSLATR